MMGISLRERNKQAAMDGVRRVAFALMEADGFDRVTVEQIAARSSVSPSTVYRYFGTKEALVLSAERPAELVKRIAKDTSDRSHAEAFVRAAVKVWDRDPSVEVELGLVVANEALTEAWERQLLDHRCAVADALARRRDAASAGAKDRARAAAYIGVVSAVLVEHRRSDGAKPLAKALQKAFDAVCE